MIAANMAPAMRKEKDKECLARCRFMAKWWGRLPGVKKDVELRLLCRGPLETRLFIPKLTPHPGKT